MTEKHNIPPEPMDQLLEQAVAAVRRAAVPPMPPGVRAATVAKMQLAAKQPRLALFYERIRAMKPRNKLVAAASFLIAVGLAVALAAVMTIRPAVAFADVKAQLQRAKTMQMTMTVSSEGQVDGKKLIPTRMKWMSKGADLRIEFDETPGAVTVVDINAGKMLVLNPISKVAKVMNLAANPAGGDPTSQDWLTCILKMLDGQDKPLGKRVIGGKAAIGFCVTKETQEIEIWVEKDNAKPLMFKTAMRVPGQPVVNVICRDFVLDKEMPDSLFSVTPPKGYTVEQLAYMDVGNAIDLIAGLKHMAGANDGVFLDQLTPSPEELNKLPATAPAATASGPSRGPAEHESGLVRARIIDPGGNSRNVPNLRPQVVIHIEKQAATPPASQPSSPTAKKTPDLVVRIEDPRGQRANLPVCGPVKIVIYDDEEGTVASADEVKAGETLTVKPKAGAKATANPELVVELRDAEGKTRDVTAGR